MYNIVGSGLYLHFIIINFIVLYINYIIYFFSVSQNETCNFFWLHAAHFGIDRKSYQNVHIFQFNTPRPKTK